MAEQEPEAKSRLFLDVINELSPTEQKWLVRVILRNMRAGLSEDRVSVCIGDYTV